MRTFFAGWAAAGSCHSLKNASRALSSSVAGACCCFLSSGLLPCSSSFSPSSWSRPASGRCWISSRSWMGRRAGAAAMAPPAASPKTSGLRSTGRGFGAATEGGSGCGASPLAPAKTIGVGFFGGPASAGCGDFSGSLRRGALGEEGRAGSAPAPESSTAGSGTGTHRGSALRSSICRAAEPSSWLRRAAPPLGALAGPGAASGGGGGMSSSSPRTVPPTSRSGAGGGTGLSSGTSMTWTRWPGTTEGTVTPPRKDCSEVWSSWPGTTSGCRACSSWAKPSSKGGPEGTGVVAACRACRTCTMPSSTGTSCIGGGGGTSTPGSGGGGGISTPGGGGSRSPGLSPGHCGRIWGSGA